LVVATLAALTVFTVYHLNN